MRILDCVCSYIFRQVRVIFSFSAQFSGYVFRLIRRGLKRGHTRQEQRRKWGVSNEKSVFHIFPMPLLESAIMSRTCHRSCNLKWSRVMEYEWKPVQRLFFFFLQLGSRASHVLQSCRVTQAQHVLPGPPPTLPTMAHSL